MVQLNLELFQLYQLYPSSSIKLNPGLCTLVYFYKPFTTKPLMWARV